MADIYILKSNGVPLAQFRHEQSDMGYLFGRIEPIVSGHVEIQDIFETTQNLDFKTVLSDWSQGYQCELESENASIPCVLMECNAQQTSFRMLTAEESVKWSKRNVRLLTIAPT